jgi:hypothetical protein
MAAEARAIIFFQTLCLVVLKMEPSEKNFTPDFQTITGHAKVYRNA